MAGCRSNLVANKALGTLKQGEMFEFREIFRKAKKPKADQRFETLNERLADIQDRIVKIRKAQHEQAGVDHDRHTLLIRIVENFQRKVDRFMATQEERLQGISNKIDEVLSDLATLKTNNPQIEDEISAIEAKLSIAQPTPGEGGGEPA